MADNKNDILDGLRDGSRKSFEAFFRAYYHDLYLWAYSIVKNADVAEDCVQEFFLDFWQKQRIKGVKGCIHNYVFRALKNYCLIHLKKDSKLVRDISHLEEEVSDENNDDIDGVKYNMKIYATVNLLPEKCKEIFLHCCIYGYSYSDAAEELGVSINTVRTQMTRAFKFLRSKLKSSEFIYFISFYNKSVCRS